MTPERLLELYDEFSDSPGAVERLRRFVLELAFRGKLVDRITTEGTGFKQYEDLRRISMDSGAKRRGKSSDVGSIDSTTDLPEIPEHWKWVKLGEVGQWGSGSTPSRGNFDFYGGGVTWLKSGELNDDQTLRGSEETITELALKQCTFRLNQPGDVLIAMYGATIGKVAILAEPAVTNQAVCGCTPYDGIYNRYLFYYLLSRRAEFHAASEGGAQPNISKVKIVNTPFPIAPLGEQERIVARVDELMGLCDELEAAEGLLRATRDRFTAASFDQVRNPDTDDPIAPLRPMFVIDYFEHSTTSSDQISSLKSLIIDVALMGLLTQNTVSKSPHPTAGNVNRMPLHWRMVKMGDICHRIHYGYTASADKSVDSVRMVRITDIQDGRVLWDQVPGCTIRESDLPKYALQNGDILIARTGGTIGKSFLVKDVELKAIFASYLIRLQPSDLVDPSFLRMYCDSGLYWRQLYEGSKGTGQPNVNGQTLSHLKVPLPPLNEQKGVVKKVHELMGLCGDLEFALDDKRVLKGQLLESALSAALNPSA